MIIFITLLLLSLLNYHPSPRGAYHILLLLSYVAAYASPLPVAHLRRWAWWGAWGLFPLVIIYPYHPFSNGNTLAMWVWGVLFFAAPPTEKKTADALLWVLAIITMLTTRSEGGLLALGAGLLFLKFGWRGLAVTAIPGAVIIAVKTLVKGRFDVRVKILADIWQSFLRQPLGHGLGSFEWFAPRPLGHPNVFMALPYQFPVTPWGTWHAHNLIGDVMYMLGFGGLALLALLWLSIWRSDKPKWASGYIVAFAVHSLVDGPIWYGSGLLLFITLKEVDFGNYFSRIWGGIGRYIRRRGFGPAVAAETSLGVDSRPADTAGVGGVGR